MVKVLRRSHVIKTGRFFIFFLLGLFTLPTAEASVKVYAEVDRNNMYESDTFTYTVTVEMPSDGVSVGEPKLPNIAGSFDLLNSQVMRSSQSSLVNGDFEVKKSIIYNFMMAPKKVGQLKLGPSTVLVDGKTMKTKDISVRVQKETQQRAQNQGQDRYNQRRNRQRSQNRRMDPFEDMDSMFSQLLRRQRGGFMGGGPGNAGPPIDPEDSFFIKVVVDKAKIYVGEQVTATWYLYTRGQVRDIDTLKYPSLNGFWKEDIEVATRLNFQREIVNGVAYNRALLASYALFPIKSGSIEIDAYEAKCSILLPSFGFGKTVQGTKKSQVLTLKVEDLPLEGKPDNFTGGVGNFTLTHKLDINSVPANQPVKLNIKFEGQGNAKLINLPTIDLPSTIEMYDKQSTAKFFKNGKSYKDYEILLVPKEEGEVLVPEMSFSAFDPEAEQYYEINPVPELFLSVTRAREGSKISDVPLQDLESSEEEPEQAYIPVIATTWDGAGTSFLLQKNTLFWAVLYFFIFASFIYIFLRELGLTQRKKTLQKLIQARFKKIDQLSTQSENWRDVGAELTNMMYLCLGAVSGEGGASLEFDKMIENSPPSVRRELSSEILKRVKACETISFAPESIVGSLKDPKNIKEQIKGINKLAIKMIDMGFGDSKGESFIEKS